MLNLGIIGTNWITHQFVEAAIASKEYQLKAVYSRSKDKADTFAKAYDNHEEIILATELEAFYELKELDVIYIASPNSLHYEQSKAALNAGKHVISEKPAVSTLAQLEELLSLAEEKGLFFFEAARHIHEDNFAKVAELVKNREDILGANLTFMKYSSRYDALLRGDNPNIFSPKFSGGALMDLGVYLVYAAVAWFGMPKETFYFHQKLPTGVDALGTMIFRYESFDVTLLTGKNTDSFLPSEIYLSNETIVLDGISSIKDITINRRGEIIDASVTKEIPQPMMEEAIAFSKVINHPDSQTEQQHYQDWNKLAKEVHGLMENIRKESGIIFDADK